MPPLPVGYMHIFIIVNHVLNMEAQDSLDLINSGLLINFYFFKMLHKDISHPEANNLQELRLGLNMIIQAGCFYAYRFCQVSHGGSRKAFFPEKLRSFANNDFFLCAVALGFNSGHSKCILKVFPFEFRTFRIQI